MSFFRTQKIACNDQNLLIKTLENLGYKPQVHDEKVKVRGHGNESRKAEVILRMEDIGEGGDIGFSKDKDGNFELVTDTYVLRKIKLADFAEKVNQEYGVAKAKAIAKKNGWTVLGTKSVTVNGKSVQRVQFATT